MSEKHSEKQTDSGNMSAKNTAVRERTSSEPEDVRFSERLKMLIPKGNVRDISRKSGVSEGSLRAYLRGSSDPGRKALIALADTLGCSVEWLAAGEGAPPAELDGTAKGVRERPAAYAEAENGQHGDLSENLARAREAAGVVAAVQREIRDIVGDRMLIAVHDLVFLGGLRPQAAAYLLEEIAAELRERAARDGQLDPGKPG